MELLTSLLCKLLSPPNTHKQQQNTKQLDNSESQSNPEDP